VGKGALAIVLVVGMVGTLRFAHPTRCNSLQSFLNTIDAIHPVISAMKAVISP
jgi:hypothetical protein